MAVSMAKIKRICWPPWAEQDPDLICISGDLIDENKSPEGAWMLLAAIGRAYPCFYVSGNHEFRTENLEELRSTIASYGVTLLAGGSGFVYDK